MDNVMESETAWLHKVAAWKCSVLEVDLSLGGEAR
jgi:hypothetical protein